MMNVNRSSYTILLLLFRKKHTCTLYLKDNSGHITIKTIASIPKYKREIKDL